MLPIGTERADISRRLVDETVSDHLVLPFETLPTLATGTSLDRTVMGPYRRMHVRVRVQKVLGLEWCRVTAGVVTYESTVGGVGEAVDAQPVRYRRRRGRPRLVRVGRRRIATTAVVRGLPVGYVGLVIVIERADAARGGQSVAR